MNFSDAEKKKSLKLLLDHAKTSEPHIMVEQSHLIYALAYIQILEKEIELLKQEKAKP